MCTTTDGVGPALLVLLLLLLNVKRMKMSVKMNVLWVRLSMWKSGAKVTLLTVGSRRRRGPPRDLKLLMQRQRLHSQKQTHRYLQRRLKVLGRWLLSRLTHNRKSNKRRSMLDARPSHSRLHAAV